MTRFLLLTQYYAPEIGASPARLGCTMRELRRQGHEVEVLTALPNHPTGHIFPSYRGHFYMQEEWDGVPVHRVWIFASVGKGAKRLLNYFSFLFTCLAGALRVRRPDWVFVESPPLFLAIPGVLLARMWGARVIFNVSDLWPDSVRGLGVMREGFFLNLADRLEAWAYRHVDFINAVTDGVANTLIEVKSVPREKVLFLPNGVDVRQFQPGPPDEALLAALGLQGKFVVLYAGTHGYAHALEHVLGAAQLLRGDRRIHFLFVGDGSEKAALMELADRLGLVNVSFLDPVPLSEMPRFLSISGCALVPQRDIPLFDGNRPAKIFPVMASGRPILFCGKGEGARLVRDARAGVVVPPEDGAALAGAIRQLMDDPKSATEMGQKGRAYVEANLNWESLVEAWLNQLCPSVVPRTYSKDV